MKKYYSYLLLLPLSLSILTGCSASEDHANEVASTGSIKDKINEKKQKNSEEDEDKKTSETEQETQETTEKEEATEKEEKTPLNTADKEATEAHQNTEDSTQHTSVNNRPWNAEKAEQLKQFMLSWQQEMGQYYKEATTNQPLYRYGMVFPDDILPGADRYNWAYGPYKEGVVPQGITIHYDPSGISEADYTVVSVYVADHPQWGPQERAYFFALTQQQEPIVFLLTQNQALPDEKIHVVPTENAALQQGFADILHQTY